MEFPDFSQYDPPRATREDTADSLIARARAAGAVKNYEHRVDPKQGTTETVEAFLFYGLAGEPAFLRRESIANYLNSHANLKKAS